MDELYNTLLEREMKPKTEVRQQAEPRIAPPLSEQLHVRDAGDAPAEEPDGGGSGSKIAHLMYLAGLGADAVTTYKNAQTEFPVGHRNHGRKFRETNPLINWAGPKWQFPVGAAMEGGAYLVGKKLLKDRHPKLFNTLLGLAGAGHGAAAISNTIALKKQTRDN